MSIQTETLLSSDLRAGLKHSIRPDTNSGIGTTDIQTALETSDGVEFEIGGEGGIYIGVVPYTDERPFERQHSADVPADGILYVYTADLDAKKRQTGGAVSETYAALRYESELFRALSEELRTVVTDVFPANNHDIRFERYDSDESGTYFILPLPPGN